MSIKKFIELYRKYKNTIHGEKIYDKTYQSSLLFMVRTNSLPLKNKTNELDKSCICGGGKEDLLHFLVHCPLYSDIRNNHAALFDPGKSPEEISADISLMSNSLNPQYAKETIYELWKKRKTLLNI